MINIDSNALRIVSKVTCIEFLLDETGSMGSFLEPTIAGFNNFLEQQKNVSGDCQITLTKFQSSGNVTPYQDLDIQIAPKMNKNLFVPGGMTNLYDAIGERIAAANRFENWSGSYDVLFIVMTDGGDNMSHRETMDSIKRKITSSKHTFVYLGANQNANIIGQKMGFKDGNIKSFEMERMAETMDDLSAATTAYRTTQTSSFF